MPSPLSDDPMSLLDEIRRAAPEPPDDLLAFWSPPPASRRRISRSWVLGAATAAVAVGTLALLPGSLLRPTPTFADVQRAMVKVNTVSRNERMTSSYELFTDGRAVKQPSYAPVRHWADLRIPAVGWGGKRFRQVSRNGQTFQSTVATRVHR